MRDWRLFLLISLTFPRLFAWAVVVEDAVVAVVEVIELGEHHLLAVVVVVELGEHHSLVAQVVVFVGLHVLVAPEAVASVASACSRHLRHLALFY